MNILSGFFRGHRASAADAPPAASVDRAAAPRLDPWFRSHYEDAARIVFSLVPPECLRAGRRVLDFGCGDGIIAFGVASRCEAQVEGVDLHRTFEALPDLCDANLGTRTLPRNLAFVQNRLGETLPFPDGSRDLVYSWSVFEHVAEPSRVLADLGRVVKPGGFVFIQVEPLFHGPFGSHLRRLVDEPWAHLGDEDAFLERAANATDHVPENERDVLYRTHAFEAMKRHLLDEYARLNRITAHDLLGHVRAAGCEIVFSKLIREETLTPPPALLARYPRELLLTNQIVLLARKR